MDKAIEMKGGRFYIRMGFNGFNLPANNGRGYKTAITALRAAKECGYRPHEGAVSPRLMLERMIQRRQEG